MSIDRAPVTRGGAQRAARHELAKPVYHRGSKPLVQRVLAWIGRELDRLLGNTAGHAPAGDLGALAIVVVLVIVAVVVIWRVGVPRRAAATGAVLTAGAPVSAAEHRMRSELAMHEGDWNTALVERMRAIARELEESGVLSPRAGRTASELAEQTAALLPTVAVALRAAARTFNDVAYGGQSASPETVASVAATDDAVRAIAASTVRAR